MAKRTRITQAPQAPESLTVTGFFTPAKISQAGDKLRVSADAETTRQTGLKDLYLPLASIVTAFGGIPAGMIVTVDLAVADGAHLLPVESIDVAQKRGPDGRRVDYRTGATGSMVPPGLVRDHWTLDGSGRHPGHLPTLQPGGRVTPRPTAPSGPTAPSEASSLAARVGQLEQGIEAILDALAVKK